MFISKYEKEEMRISVRTLQAKVKELEERIDRISRIVTRDALSVKNRQWSESSKRALSESMKKSWEARKAKRAAMAQISTHETKA